MKHTFFAVSIPTFLIGCVLVFILLFSIPLSVEAAGLVPCGGLGEPECNVCQLVQLAENIVEFYIKIAFVAAALLFAVAGFMFFTSGADPGKITTARKIFTNTIIGIIIILTSWLVINVIFTVLVGEGVNPFVKTRLSCDKTTPSAPSGVYNAGYSVTGGKTLEQRQRELEEARDLQDYQIKRREEIKEEEEINQPPTQEDWYFSVGVDTFGPYRSLDECSRYSVPVNGGICHKQ